MISPRIGDALAFKPVAAEKGTRMGRSNVWSILALFSIALISIGVFVWVVSGLPFAPCTVPSNVENYVKAIASLDQVVDLSIKLSTTLAGLGAALLLGLKSGLKSTALVRLLVVIGTICFVESALYAVWWRTGISEVWFNDCPPLVAESRLTYRFDAHFGFFVAGIIFLGILVVTALFSDPKSSANGDMS